MSDIPKALLDCINEGMETDKVNCSIGLFMNDCYAEAENEEDAIKVYDSLMFKKPMISISSFIEDNELFYEVVFKFNSYEDADYKRMWNFLCQLSDKVKRERELFLAKRELEKMTSLSVSILPDQYDGKYFVFINMPLYETISTSVNAWDRSATISLICDEESLAGLIADDDLIDPQLIEREVEEELVAETSELQ